MEADGQGPEVATASPETAPPTSPSTWTDSIPPSPRAPARPRSWLTFRRAVEEGLLDPVRTIQIGIRGAVNDPDVWKFSHDSGMRVVTMEEFHEMGIKEGSTGRAGRPR